MALLHRLQAYLGKITAVNPTFTNVYTVPAGQRFVIKTVTARNLDSGTARTAYMELNGLLAWSQSMAAGGAAGSFIELDTDIVLHPGDVIALAVSGGTAGALFTISGSIYNV